ncbi:MAG TPA: metal-dependent hydrolase, partial [Dokdonella sp.]
MAPLKYLTGYAPAVVERVRALIEQDKLGDHLRERYGVAHAVRNDRALFEYAVDLKERYMRKAEPLNKVVYDNKLQVVKHALGTHTAVSRVQGGRLKASREIRIATVFRDAPA